MNKKLRLESLEDRTTPATFTPLASAFDGTDGSLRAAIIAANANADAANTFTLEAGTYRLSIANTAGQENAAAEGDLDLTAAKTYVIEGAGAGATVIDGASLDRVFHLFPGSNVILRNLTVTGGLAQDNGDDGADADTAALGGGILAR